MPLLWTPKYSTLRTMQNLPIPSIYKSTQLFIINSNVICYQIWMILTLLTLYNSRPLSMYKHYRTIRESNSFHIASHIKVLPVVAGMILHNINTNYSRPFTHTHKYSFLSYVKNLSLIYVISNVHICTLGTCLI